MLDSGRHVTGISKNIYISANNIDANYWILDTDYTNFAVVYSCRDMGGVMSGSKLKPVWSDIFNN